MSIKIECKGTIWDMKIRQLKNKVFNFLLLCASVTKWSISSSSHYLNYWWPSPLKHNRNAACLRNTVRQTSRGKSAAAGRTAGAPQPLTSRGTSAWPYHVTRQYSFYPVQIYSWHNNSEALKFKIQWFTKEWHTHTCMTSPAMPPTR